MDNLISELKKLEGIEVELCGSWVWVSGNTKAVKDKLKGLGLFYASKKKKWYKKPDNYKSFKHRPVSMDKIRFKYGSEVVA